MAVKKASKMKRKSVNAKATTSKPAMRKLPAIKEAMSKTTLLNTITDCTSVARKDVKAVWECLEKLIEGHMQKKGPGKFVMPGYMKMITVQKPARPARKGINPFTGEPTTFKAKPASRAIKIRPLKKLKEMVA